MQKKYLSNLKTAINSLKKKQIIAYPTESVFGLGCDPDNENAVHYLLKLKQRTWKKGFILVSANYSQLKNYIDDNSLNNNIKKKMFKYWPGYITWIIPAKYNTPKWLTGEHSTIAVRISAFKPIQRLCLAFGKPLISTSANIQGFPPAKTSYEVRKQFGKKIIILDEPVEGKFKPSEIRELINGKIIRKG